MVVMNNTSAFFLTFLLVLVTMEKLNYVNIYFLPMSSSVQSIKTLGSLPSWGHCGADVETLFDSETSSQEVDSSLNKHQNQYVCHSWGDLNWRRIIHNMILLLRTLEVPSMVRYQKIKPNYMLSQTFSTIFSYYYCKSWKYVCVMKGMFWTDEKLSLIVAWSIGHHPFKFPAPKFRVLLDVWFGFWYLAEAQ